jgi:hypothetical protein
MGFTGLVPSEYSSGEATRRGHITKAGNRAVRTVLVEAAHAYRHHPAIGAVLARRQTRAGLQSRRPVLGCPAAPMRPLPADERPPQAHRRHRHRGRPRARRVRLGRDDHMTQPSPARARMPAHVPRAHKPMTSRGGAAAGLTPGSAMRPAWRRAAVSEGHLPAHPGTATSTHEYQSGSGPTHHRAPGRHPHQPRPPPAIVAAAQPGPRQDRSSSLRCGRSALTPRPLPPAQDREDRPQGKQGKPPQPGITRVQKLDETVPYQLTAMPQRRRPVAGVLRTCLCWPVAGAAPGEADAGAWASVAAGSPGWPRPGWGDGPWPVRRAPGFAGQPGGQTVRIGEIHRRQLRRACCCGAPAAAWIAGVSQ